MLSPIYLETAVVVLGVLLLMYDAFSKGSKNIVAWLGILGLSAVLAASFFSAVPADQSAPFWKFYKADTSAMFFKRIALLTTIVVLVISLEYKAVVRNFIYGGHSEAGLGEFYALPIFTCAGLMWMASAVDFVFIFVALELVTISFYVLTSYMRRHTPSLEAGVKYLILGALSTGFLVYGITWVFGITGQTNLDAIAAAIPTSEGNATPLLFGIVLILVALCFKIAAAPFQFWVPDVYQGAPTPVTAFLSVGSKAAGFIVLLRVLETFLVTTPLHQKVVPVLGVLAGVTLIYGNLAALPQSNLKRLLAYSSIAHAGYLLVAVASIGAPTAGLAIGVYLGAYLLMTLLSFIVLAVVSRDSGSDEISSFNGLSKRSPLLTFALLTAMLSLAGMPFTAGFIGKFLVFNAAYEQQQYALLFVGLITVAAGFYYYLKVVKAMFWLEPTSTGRIAVAPLTKLTIIVLSALIFVAGVYPKPAFAMLKSKSVAQQH